MNNQVQEKNTRSAEFFDQISVSVASPDEMLSWSHGEVKKPETINYRTQKPERDGLFCEKIFGPTKNYECYCGKYKRIRYKGVICEKCGVEVTHSSVRRNRMGHIKLAVPVTHIWFLRSTPSRIGLLLELPIKAIEQVVYFAAYIITEVDEVAKAESKEQLQNEFKSVRKKIQEEGQKLIADAKNSKDESRVEKLEKETAQKINELDKHHQKTREELEDLKVAKIYSEIEYRELSSKFGQIFRAGIGAEAIREIIQNLDLNQLILDLEADLKKSTGQKQKKIIKRLKLAGSLLKAGISAEWMVMTVLPVIPPDLRPMVQLDGGRYAASDLNDLYRRVINRNNRLKRLISIGAPEVISRNEKRMLQEAVDTLLNNSARQGKTVFNSGDKRKLRSLSDMLKGKQGRFRQNLLGKRVDYSGRSVIVVGPQLKLNQCGLPKTMALELFKPFVIGRLISDGLAHNIKSSEKLIQAGTREVWDILEEVTSNRYVLLNRAPTLHRLGIQAFKPKLIEGKAIQIHPLVCTAFNADFDGDQMAVHVPLSKQAQEEARNLIASFKNLLKPSAGEPIVTPTQDMVLGCYYITKDTPGKAGEGMVFSDINEAIMAWREGFLHLQAKIKARFRGEIRETTLGRLIFNSYVPTELEYCNETVGKKQLNVLLNDSFLKAGSLKTAKFVDHLKRMGFEFATYSGLSIAASDMLIPPDKEAIIKDAELQVKDINTLYQNGIITENERYNQTIKIWVKAKGAITESMIAQIDPENDLHYMINSGARGNWGQITQLCGMKGNVANPAGKTIELPITSNLKEGFSILEYFIATHGGRKGKSDTALKTAEAGHLTRRLVDSVQDIIIKEYDCGSNAVHHVSKTESENIGIKLENRIFGRTLAEDLVDKKTGEVIATAGTEIDRDILKAISDNDIEEIGVRSVITCKTKNGICVKCYGRDLGTNQTVEVGTAVGIIAAQSIGEPGTQLTMRTFHMGGVASAEGDITQGLSRVEELFEARNPKSPALMAEIDGKVKISRKGPNTEIHLNSEEPVEAVYQLGSELEATVKEGDIVKEKEVIARAKNSKNSTRSEYNGKVIEANDAIVKIRSAEPIEKTYKVPFGKIIKVNDNQRIAKGTALCSGHLNLRQLLELTEVYNVQAYLVSEVQKIYASQGQTINDKHIEIIARQMLSKVRVLDPGEGTYLAGEIADILAVDEDNEKLRAEGKKEIIFERLLLGLTRISLYTDSWLSAASFQETIRVLVEAATTNKIHKLEGLKENVIIGKLIPAGGTYRRKHPEMIPENEELFARDYDYEDLTEGEIAYPVI